MRPGLLPSQQRAMRKAFKKAEKFDHFRQRTRRTFLALFGLAVGTGAGGFWLGSVRHRAVDDAWAPLVSHLHELALGSTDNLERRAVHVVDGFVANPADERLAYGVQRLVVLAGAKPEGDVLRVRLRQLHRSVAAMPEHVRSSLEQLERLQGR